MLLKAGTRLTSVACGTQVVVVRAPPREVEISCGGPPMVGHEAGDADRSPLDPERAGGTLLGKRYGDEAGELELLCTRAGEGSLVCDGIPLIVKQPKPLPSSD